MGLLALGISDEDTAEPPRAISAIKPSSGIRWKQLESDGDIYDRHSPTFPPIPFTAAENQIKKLKINFYPRSQSAFLLFCCVTAQPRLVLILH